MSSSRFYFDWKHITFFTYHLDVFEGYPNFVVKSFRRLSKYSFNVTITIRFSNNDLIHNEGYLESFEEIIEIIYEKYVKSERYKRESYENVNQMVHDLYVKYPNLR